jgi:DNA-binding transcriptional MerR regulator
MNERRWRLEQLVDRVGRVLAEEGPGGESRRVRWTPDARTARYYTTLGLLSRPAEMRGRTAYYSERHLMELLAIKRLQSEGCSLEVVQQRLAGLPEDALRLLARPPEWALQPSPDEAGAIEAGTGPAARGAFWQTTPSEPAPAEDSSPDGWAAMLSPIKPQARPAIEPDSSDSVCAAAMAVRLAVGATLIVELPPEALGPRQVKAIREAARELLDKLRELGLDDVEGGSS